MVTNLRVDLRFKLYQPATARLTQDWETGVPRLLGPGTSSSPGSTLTMFLGVAEERGDMVTSHQSPVTSLGASHRRGSAAGRNLAG